MRSPSLIKLGAASAVTVAMLAVFILAGLAAASVYATIGNPFYLRDIVFLIPAVPAFLVYVPVVIVAFTSRRFANRVLEYVMRKFPANGR